MSDDARLRARRRAMLLAAVRADDPSRCPYRPGRTSARLRYAPGVDPRLSDDEAALVADLARFEGLTVTGGIRSSRG